MTDEMYSGEAYDAFREQRSEWLDEEASNLMADAAAAYDALELAGDPEDSILNHDGWLTLGLDSVGGPSDEDLPF